MKKIKVELKPGELARKYIVGTFPSERKRQPLAYSRDYNSSWKGCVEYEVHAPSGKEAKRAAIKARMDDGT